MSANEVYGEHIIPRVFTEKDITKTMKLSLVLEASGYRVQIDMSNTPSNEQKAYCRVLKYKLENRIRQEFHSEKDHNINAYTSLLTIGKNLSISGLLNKHVAKKYFDLISGHLMMEINDLAFTRQNVAWANVPSHLMYWCVFANKVAVFSDCEPVINIRTGEFEFPVGVEVVEADTYGFWGDWKHSVLKRGEESISYIAPRFLEAEQTQELVKAIL